MTPVPLVDPAEADPRRPTQPATTSYEIRTRERGPVARLQFRQRTTHVHRGMDTRSSGAVRVRTGGAARMRTGGAARVFDEWRA